MTRPAQFSRALWCAALLLTASFARLAAMPLPDDGGYLDVTKPPYNAVPNDGRDDTQSIQQAIHDVLKTEQRYHTPKFIYLPDGVYDVSTTIYSKATLNPKAWSNGWASGMILIGQSPEKTILQLADGAPGFGDPAKPKAMIATGSENPAAGGGGNQAFRHSIIDLTLKTGRNNPGSVGIDYQVSNRGTVKNVSILSGDGKGIAGIRMTRPQEGPGLIKHVTVTGFDYAILASQWDFSMTIEGLRIEGQSKAGIRTESQPLFIRQLISDNTVPAIELLKGGHITLLDSTLSGGAPSNTAIILKAGGFFARNVLCEGYGKVIESETGSKTGVAGGAGRQVVAEYVSHPVASLFPSPGTSLNLPIEETPQFHTADISQWANMKNFAAGSRTAGIQEAIDSGKAIVYLPNGTYGIDEDVVIRGNVKKIMGMHSSISRPKGGRQTIRFEGDGATILEHLRLGVPVEHRGSGTLVLQNVDLDELVSTSAASTGKLFLEDVIANNASFAGHARIWGRQVNSESSNGSGILNKGTTLWILGLKHERNQILVENLGGKVELQGVFEYDYGQFSPDRPFFVNDEGSLSFSKVGHHGKYPIFVKERRHGVWKEVPKGQAPYNVPLYTGYPAK